MGLYRDNLETIIRQLVRPKLSSSALGCTMLHSHASPEASAAASAAIRLNPI